MSGDKQIWIGIGGLVRDPVSKGNDSLACAHYTIGITKTWKSGGETKRKTFYARCKSFGKQAEFVLKYAKAKHKCIVEGEVYEEEYTNAAGEKKTITIIEASDFKLIGHVMQRQDETGTSNETPEERPAGYSDQDPF